MRYNYPISSKQLKDTINEIYESQLYILGYADSSGVFTNSGICDLIDASGTTIFSSGYVVFEDLNPYIGKSNYFIN
jgi:hypothetical protein